MHILCSTRASDLHDPDTSLSALQLAASVTVLRSTKYCTCGYQPMLGKIKTSGRERTFTWPIISFTGYMGGIVGEMYIFVLILCRKCKMPCYEIVDERCDNARHDWAD